MSASARMMAGGQRVNGAISVTPQPSGHPTWAATYVTREWPYATAQTDAVHIVEQVGTRYRAGVGIIHEVTEVDPEYPECLPMYIVDVIPSTALVEWEGAE